MVSFEERCMLEQITGKKYSSVLTPEQERQFSEMKQRRQNGEPLQYILGEWEFYGMRYFIGEGVLIPRPETELLTETVLKWCENKKNLKILDLCTGSGCIALTLKKYLPEAEVSAVDISETALSYARKNAEYHHLSVNFYQADVKSRTFAGQFRNYDVIVSNPPYLTEEEMTELQPEVRHEPVTALYGGKDGTEFYQQITAVWKETLHSGGLLAFEIGWKQAESVCHILRDSAFQQIQVIQDYEHRDRNITGEKN